MKYQSLLDKVHEIYDLRKAARVLTWDRATIMPKGGDTDRIQQIATLHRLSHMMFTSDEMGTLIEEAAIELNGVQYDSTEASLIRFLRRDYSQSRRLPAEFVSRHTTLNSESEAAWKQAREEDDFSYFQPWLEQLVEMAQEMAALYGYEDEPYDALLNQYEPGAKSADVRQTFTAAKEALLPLYQAVGRKRLAVHDSFLHQPFDLAKQEAFAHFIANAIGYDFNRGYLATAVHPFSTSLSRNDVRITIRYYPNFISPSIFATLHEAGHAMYVQNVHPALTRTPLAKETSAGLDESQSRLIENMVGRSRGFWRVHLPHLKEYFPQLEEVTLDQFYRAINKVQPGFIRVEADELTYNMHIILRFEIEQDLLSGRLPVRDVPEAWNQKMKAFLGIVPKTNREGCLQDIHWAMVGFGYFPTYTLGNLYAAQFYETALEDNPTLSDELEAGQISGLLSWLQENIQQHGRKLTPAEVVTRATKRPLSHESFVRYVTKKYSEIYNL
ncbi:MAG: carboxypeptidase M32 [Candidatus Promineifilaceae bacterium]